MKRKKAKKVGHIKATGARLEGFEDWVDPISSEPVKGREDDMSNFIARFAVWMRPQAKGSRQVGAGLTTSNQSSLRTLGAPGSQQPSIEVHHSEGLHMGQQARHRFGPML